MDQFSGSRSLTYSDGYVEKFEKLEEGKRDDGLFGVKIKAVIKRRQLIEKLKEAKVISTKVEGQSLFGELVTQIQAENNAAKLLEKSLEGLPLNILEARLVDQKPQILKKDETGAVVAWTISISYNQADYQKKIVPLLQKTFGDIAKRKGANKLLEQSRYYNDNLVWRSAQDKTIMFTLDHDWPYVKWPDTKDRDHAYTKFDVDMSRSDQNSDLLVLLNVARNGPTGRRWTWYVVDRATCMAVFERYFQTRYELRVKLLDAEGNTVRENSGEVNEQLVLFSYGAPIAQEVWPYWFVWPSEARAGNLRMLKRNKKEAKVVNIAPTFLIGNGDARHSHDVLTATYTAQLALDEIQKITKVECSFKPRVLEKEPTDP